MNSLLSNIRQNRNVVIWWYRWFSITFAATAVLIYSIQCRGNSLLCYWWCSCARIIVMEVVQRWQFRLDRIAVPNFRKFMYRHFGKISGRRYTVLINYTSTVLMVLSKRISWFHVELKMVTTDIFVFTNSVVESCFRRHIDLLGIR